MGSVEVPTGCHARLLASRRSMMYFLISEPPSSRGGDQVKVTVSSVISLALMSSGGPGTSRNKVYRRLAHVP